MNSSNKYGFSEREMKYIPHRQLRKANHGSFSVDGICLALIAVLILLALTYSYQQVSSYVDSVVSVAHAADPVYQFCNNGIINTAGTGTIVQMSTTTFAANYRELCSN